MNNIIQGDCVELLKGLSPDSIDLVVTSPPYDNLRGYHGYEFDFEKIARQLFRAIKKGGVVVWVVGDQVVNGSESGTSFRQALGFLEIGFRLHDTMIYNASGLTMNHNRYEQEFEYMFVFSKGKPKTFNPIMVKTKWFGLDGDRTGQVVKRHPDKKRKLRGDKRRTSVQKAKIKGNIWEYSTGKNNSTLDKIAFGHPAIFPEKLARDHILSWSNPGDIVLDPMCGSGTTCKMAKENGRQYIGFDISEEYCEIARKRIAGADVPLFTMGHDG